MANELHKSNAKCFKTIHNPGNISPTVIILVSKLTLKREVHRKSDVSLWSEIFNCYALRMNYTSPTQNVPNNS